MSDEIAGWYDDFLDRRMVSYRIDGNPRIALANTFVTSFASSTDSCLDVGCGIGITTEALAAVCDQGTVFGVDLSQGNISYARRTVSARNVQFGVVDLLATDNALPALVTAPVTLVTLVDVLEHIPIEYHDLAMERILAVADENVTIAATFPSAAYQTYLRTSNPGELQPIDEIIELDHFRSLGARHGMELVWWAERDVWLTGQYIHAALRRGPRLVDHDPPGSRSFRRRVIGRIGRSARKRKFGRR